MIEIIEATEYCKINDCEIHKIQSANVVSNHNCYDVQINNIEQCQFMTKISSVGQDHGDLPRINSLRKATESKLIITI